MYVPRFRTASSPRPGRAKAITALATVSVVLAAAGSASAEPKQSAPAKKGCEVQLKGEGAGQSIVYADGYSFSVYAKSDNKTHARASPGVGLGMKLNPAGPGVAPAERIDLPNGLAQERKDLMSASGKDRLLQFYEEVANAGALDRIDEFCTDDFVDHEEFPGISSDREGVKQFFTMMRTAFPDMHMTPQTVMEDGDRVIARFRMTGTHRGEFMGVPPSGRRIEIEGYDEVRIVDGRASEHWGSMDGMALMQQLGAVPEGEPAG